MSWKDLFKPDDKDPKNIVEWLGLITDEIKKFKNSDNWYDTVKLITDASIIDNLETDVSDFALSARQGYILNQKIILSNEAIELIKENISNIEAEIAESNNKIDDIKDNDLASIKNCIENIVLVLIEHSINLDSQQTQINELGERVSTNEVNIEDHEKRITTNEEDILSINDTIELLVGNNVKVSGLNVAIDIENLQLTVGIGKAIIQGKIVEIKEPITIDIDESILVDTKLLYVLIKNDAENESIIIELSETDMDISSLRIHTILVNNGIIIESSDDSNMVSLDSIIGISADRESESIRDTIPSGFTTLGELDYDYMRNNENQIKFKTKSIAYIYGYKIEIPENTIIDINKLPEKDIREDLVFLEAWKDNDFLKNGQLKWKIRVIDDVDFATYNSDGFRKDNIFIGASEYNSKVTAQGGNTSPIVFDSSLSNNNNIARIAFYSNKVRLGSYGNVTSKTKINDTGLYMSGQGDKKSIEVLKTLDGYVYAIPMFRLYRRPSCGKAIPFEYDKINKLCNYNKAKELLTSERVERVTNEIINGKSLLNHCNSMRDFTSNGVASNTTSVSNNIFTITTTSNGSCIAVTKDLLTLKPSTEYTIVIKNVYSNVELFIGDRVNGGGFLNTFIPSTKLTSNTKNIIKFTTGETFESYTIWIGRTDSINSGSTINISEMMILEGDWTNSMYVPKYFEGISSLGEDEYNVVKVKNGIIGKDTYDVTSGVQKLNTFEDVTHLSCDNNIKPMVEAVIKNGEEETPLESLNTKLETTGEEIIEFAKIKGKTIQNLFGGDDPNIQDKYNRLQCGNIKNENMYLPGQYTLINLSNKLIIPNEYEGVTFIRQIFCNPRSKSLITLQSGRSIEEVVARYTDGWTSNDLNHFLNSLLILKGDYTNIPLEELPFVEGIKSVGEDEGNIIKLKSSNINLAPKLNDTRWIAHTNLVSLGETYVTLKGSPSIYSLEGLQVHPNTDYTINGYVDSTVNHRIQIILPNTTSNNVELWVNASAKKFTLAFNTGDNTFINVCLRGEHNTEVTFRDIQIIEGIEDLPYINPLRFNQNIYLKEPLRSLPDGTCDELIGNKIIRRIGKTILDEKLNWEYNSELNETNTCRFKLDFPNLVVGPKKYICDKFMARDDISHGDYEYLLMHQNILYINILRNRLDAINLDGFRNWIMNNNVTIYYKLENEIEEYIEQVYDKESIKTYQLDAPLRSLPNGIKDEIKDGILIRRLGEIIMDGSEDEAWVKDVNPTDNTIAFRNNTKLNAKYLRPTQDNLISSLFPPYFDLYRGSLEGVSIYTEQIIAFRINKSKLSTNDVNGFKTWLKLNPVKLIYELDYSKEMILTECKPQNVDYSLNRQFKEGNYLRELPNGVKDSIENGKVIRRVCKIVYKGTNDEEWYTSSDVEYTDCIRFNITVSDIKPGETSCVMCDRFEYRYIHYSLVNSSERNKEGITQHSKESQLNITILKSRLSTVNLNGFKKWLSENPVTVYYELATPVEETLTSNNYTYYPSHDRFNTSCGSLYITDGNNNINTLNNIKSNNNIIETDYRVIEDRSEVIDARYKPSIYGKEISKKIPSGKNKINMFDYTLNDTDGNVIIKKDGSSIKYSSKVSNGSFPFRYFINLKPRTKYTISCNIVSESDRGCLYVNESSSDQDITMNNFNTNKICQLTSNDNVKTFTTGDVGSIIVSTNIYSSTQNIVFSIDSLQIEEGDQKTEYEEFIPDIRVFENVESNDIADIRKTVSLSGFNYENMLNKTLHLLMSGEI